MYFIRALLAVILLAGCGSSKNAPSEKTAATPASGTTAPATIMDIAECKDYLERMERCAQALPADQQASWRDGTSRGRAEWERRLAKGGAERDFVRTACAYATHSMQDSAKYVRTCDGVRDDAPAQLSAPNRGAAVYTIPACVEYMSKMEKCLAAKDLKPAVRDLFQKTFDEKRALFEATPEGTEAFSQLPDACRAISDANRTAMSTLCPGVW